VPAVMPTRKALALIVMLAAGIVVASCGPAQIKGNIVVGADVNPDVRGRPSPIAIKVFELKSLAAFETADFFSLFDKDKETLGADFVGRDEMSLVPGERKAFKRELNDDTRYVGVIAAFRDLEHATWRAALTVRPRRTTSIMVQLESRKVSIVAE